MRNEAQAGEESRASDLGGAKKRHEGKDDNASRMAEGKKRQEKQGSGTVKSDAGARNPACQKPKVEPDDIAESRKTRSRQQKSATEEQEKGRKAGCIHRVNMCPWGKGQQSNIRE